MPFAGKLVIRPIAHRLWTSGPGKDRAKAYRRLVALLTLFLVAHVVQMVKGGSVAGNIELGLVARGYAAAYALANALVVLAQADLLWRAVRFRRADPRYRVPPIVRGWPDLGELVLCGVVTCVGQYLFDLC